MSDSFARIVFPPCKHHPGIESVYHCESCQGCFCPECIKIKDFGAGYVGYICKDCGGRCIDIRPVEIDQQAQVFASGKSLWQQIPQIMAYPFRGKGPYLLFGGTIFFTILDFTMHMSVAGLVIGIFLYFANVACCINIIRASSVPNGDDPPDWPDFTLLSHWLMPGILIIGGALLYFAPAWFYFNSVKEKDLYFWMLIIAGAYVYPMVFLNICLTETARSLNPLINLLAIIRTVAPYTALVVFLQILVFIVNRIDVGLHVIPVLGTILKSALSIYFLFVSMRAYGLFYRANEQRLF